VRREAVQGLVLNGTEEASLILLNALATATVRTRETLIHDLVSTRDERAAPLFAFLLRRVDRRAYPQVYAAAIEALGTFGGADAVGALSFALREGQWWAPLRTRRFRGAIAAALRTIGTEPAVEALQAAAKTGSRGVRSAARVELSRIPSKEPA
jgi:HEAT repeat protein